MLDFHEKRKLKRICYSKGMVAFLGLIILLSGVQVWGVFQKDREARVRKAEVAASYEQLIERETELKEEIARLSTERGVEEVLRTKFDVARPGEGVIVLIEPKDQQSANDDKDGGFFDWVFNIF